MGGGGGGGGAVVGVDEVGVAVAVEVGGLDSGGPASGEDHGGLLELLLGLEEGGLDCGGGSAKKGAERE